MIVNRLISSILMKAYNLTCCKITQKLCALFTHFIVLTLALVQALFWPSWN